MSGALDTLAARVERLDGPDREIDGEIKLAFAADLFAAGVSKDDAVEILGGDLYADPRPYTGSIDAAMQLVPEGMEKELTDLYGVARVWVGLNTEGGGWHGEHVGGNLVLALLSAALKAREAQS